MSQLTPRDIHLLRVEAHCTTQRDSTHTELINPLAPDFFF